MKFVIRAVRCGFALLLLNVLASSTALAISLYNEKVYNSLIADRKAYLPGDLLTVIVLETANAQTSADLSSGREIRTALEASYSAYKQGSSAALRGQGKIGAKTGRAGNIKAALTVTIKSVLPHGIYYVEGRQRIQINGEQQMIILRGSVRAEDITPQNTLLSTRLADAQITYTGEGAVSNTQRYNYLYKMMSLMGLV